ncbi:MAG: class I SAM-dependent methyltransferase [Gemmatimonadota bacterium]
MPERQADCPCCGGATEQADQFAVVRGWVYVRCRSCKLVYLDPRPTPVELEAFYNDLYHHPRECSRNFRKDEERVLALLEGMLGRPGRLLEVGCSYGDFLLAAKRRGWIVTGLEVNRDTSRFARERLGLDVRQGTIGTVKGSAGRRYQALAAWHLLEHEPDPGSFIREAWCLLDEQGLLAIRVPNMSSSIASLAGPHWQWLSPPEHVCMFSRDNLTGLLLRYGFDVVHRETMRGHARGLCFEAMRARAKQIFMQLTRPAESGFAYAPRMIYEDRPWYRMVERTVDAFSNPIEFLISGWMRREDREAELFVIGRKRSCLSRGDAA